MKMRADSLVYLTWEPGILGLWEMEFSFVESATWRDKYVTLQHFSRPCIGYILLTTLRVKSETCTSILRRHSKACSIELSNKS